MTRSRLLAVTLGLAFWGIAVWLGLRGAAWLGRQIGHGPAGASRVGAESRAVGGRWTAAEREAIERVARKGYRPALPSDAVATPERDDLQALYGAYDPYFVRGDLNDDGHPDFVQAFVREREGSVLFDVAVFFGLEGGGYAPPVFVERGVELGNGDVAVDRTLVILTPDLVSDETYRYRFDAETRKFEDVDATSGHKDDDAPEESPDQRLRTKV